ncbi:hypothetical protein D3C80_1037100 [compost metagenome]
MSLKSYCKPVRPLQPSSSTEPELAVEGWIPVTAVAEVETRRWSYSRSSWVQRRPKMARKSSVKLKVFSPNSATLSLVVE